KRKSSEQEGSSVGLATLRSILVASLLAELDEPAILRGSLCSAVLNMLALSKRSIY
ncbi:hypothetical protein BaRGS_00037174, partial [Batillaria attramentaria]